MCIPTIHQITFAQRCVMEMFGPTVIECTPKMAQELIHTNVFSMV